ncbi:AMP-binding protein [Shewanella sp.]|uniref:AMP-binding protein n=1 Tax=Shewanella sp. TaxID=50422 RepID=UPI003A977861
MTDTLQHLAEQFTDRPALTDGQQQLSYQQLYRRVQALSETFTALQLRSVALHGGNSIDWVIVDLACQQANIVLLPLPPFFSLSQIDACLEQAGSQLLLSEDAGLAAKLQQTVAPLTSRIARYHAVSITPKQPAQLPQGTAKITFTSGSTGHPKGVCLTSEHQWRVAKSLATVTALSQPKHLALLPLSTLLENIAGIYSPLLCGGTVILSSEQQRGMLGSSKLDAKALLACISQSQPNSIILIPQLLLLLVNACLQGWQPPASLQFVAVGGGKVSPALLAQAHQLGLPVYEGYGLSECGSVVALNTATQQIDGSVGQVLPHCQVAIINNEVVVSGACHLGYAGVPSSWYPDKIFTGDLGQRRNGWLWINGRSKNLLISSFGRNISPEWVESEIMAEPFIRQCMVLGDAEPYLSAIVSCSDVVDNVQLAAYMARVNQQLPDYAQVWHWLRVSPEQLLPFTTANGRLKREAIVSAFAEQIAALYQGESAAS